MFPIFFIENIHQKIFSFYTKLYYLCHVEVDNMGHLLQSLILPL